MPCPPSAMPVDKVSGVCGTSEGRCQKSLQHCNGLQVRKGVLPHTHPCRSAVDGATGRLRASWRLMEG